MKEILGILSIWVLFSFLILLKKRILNPAIISIVLTSNIIGIYILKRYEERIPEKYKKIINISDIMLHYLPLLFILFILKIKKGNKMNYLNYLIIYLIFALIYLNTFSPSKTYWFTQMSDEDLFLFHISIYLLILLIYFK
jgi:hypothetical protein